MKKITENQIRTIKNLIIISDLSLVYDLPKIAHIASEGTTKKLEDLSLFEGYKAHTFLLSFYRRYSRRRNIILLSYECGIYGIETPDYTDENYAKIEELTLRVHKKEFKELTVSELDVLIGSIKTMRNQMQKEEIQRQRSADYYQATKATNQLLKNLKMPKQKVISKKDK